MYSTSVDIAQLLSILEVHIYHASDDPLFIPNRPRPTCLILVKNIF